MREPRSAIYYMKSVFLSNCSLMMPETLLCRIPFISVPDSAAQKDSNYSAFTTNIDLNLAHPSHRSGEYLQIKAKFLLTFLIIKMSLPRR